MSMIDTEGSARTDYTGLLRHLLQRVDQLSLGAGQGVPPDEPPPPGSRAEAVLHRFRQELHAFQPRDLPRMMRLVGALDS